MTVYQSPFRAVLLGFLIGSIVSLTFQRFFFSHQKPSIVLEKPIKLLFSVCCDVNAGRIKKGSRLYILCYWPKIKSGIFLGKLNPKLNKIAISDRKSFIYHECSVQWSNLGSIASV